MYINFASARCLLNNFKVTTVLVFNILFDIITNKHFYEYIINKNKKIPEKLVTYNFVRAKTLEKIIDRQTSDKVLRDVPLHRH